MRPSDFCDVKRNDGRHPKVSWNLSLIFTTTFNPQILYELSGANPILKHALNNGAGNLLVKATAAFSRRSPLSSYPWWLHEVWAEFHIYSVVIKHPHSRQPEQWRQALYEYSCHQERKLRQRECSLRIESRIKTIYMRSGRLRRFIARRWTTTQSMARLTVQLLSFHWAIRFACSCPQRLIRCLRRQRRARRAW